jgi:hypothetical protein
MVSPIQQALRVVGDLHLRRDKTAFHEETFVCRKFFAIGNEEYTTHLHVRVTNRRPAEVASSRDLGPLIDFLQYLRRVSPKLRSAWLRPRNKTTFVRTFKWRYKHDDAHLTLMVRNRQLLCLVSTDWESGRRWMENELGGWGTFMHDVQWID